MLAYLRKKYEISLITLAILQIKADVCIGGRQFRAKEIATASSRYNKFLMHQAHFMLESFHELYNYGEFDQYGMNDALVEYVQMPTNEEEWIEQLPKKQAYYEELILSHLSHDEKHGLARLCYQVQYHPGTFFFDDDDFSQEHYDSKNRDIMEDKPLLYYKFDEAIRSCYKEVMLDDLFL